MLVALAEQQLIVLHRVVLAVEVAQVKLARLEQTVCLARVVMAEMD